MLEEAKWLTGNITKVDQSKATTSLWRLSFLWHSWLSIKKRKEWKPASWLPLNWFEAHLLKPHESQRSRCFFFPGALETGHSLLWGCWPFFPAYPQSPPARRRKEIRPNTNQTSAYYLLRLGPVMRAGSRQKEADYTPYLTSTRTVVLWLSLTNHTSKTKRTESPSSWMRQGATLMGL